MYKYTVSRGNLKIKNCNIFNLPTGITCRGQIECRGYCYAKKAERLWRGVSKSRYRNYYHSLHDEDFSGNISSILSHRKETVTRIHESGDFYSIPYIIKWYRIASATPNVRFYAYTKRSDLFSEQILDMKPRNLTLIWSVDGIRTTHQRIQQGFNEAQMMIGLGFDKASIVIGKDLGVNKKLLKNLCPAIGTDKKCQVDCSRCVDRTTKYILFKQH